MVLLCLQYFGGRHRYCQRNPSGSTGWRDYTKSCANHMLLGYLSIKDRCGSYKRSLSEYAGHPRMALRAPEEKTAQSATSGSQTVKTCNSQLYLHR